MFDLKTKYRIRLVRPTGLRVLYRHATRKAGSKHRERRRERNRRNGKQLSGAAVSAKASNRIWTIRKCTPPGAESTEKHRCCMISCREIGYSKGHGMKVQGQNNQVYFTYSRYSRPSILSSSSLLYHYPIVESANFPRENTYIYIYISYNTNTRSCILNENTQRSNNQTPARTNTPKVENCNAVCLYFPRTKSTVGVCDR